MFLSQQLEQKVHDIENFYSSMNKNQTSTPKGNSAAKDKDKEKHVPFERNTLMYAMNLINVNPKMRWYEVEGRERNTEKRER